MFESKELLLVEDNPGSRELTLRALQANPLVNNVQIVSDGAEALDYVSQPGKHADRDPRKPPLLVVLETAARRRLGNAPSVPERGMHAADPGRRVLRVAKRK